MDVGDFTLFRNNLVNILNVMECPWNLTQPYTLCCYVIFETCSLKSRSKTGPYVSKTEMGKVYRVFESFED